MGKSKGSILTAISAIAMTFTNGLFTLVVTKLIIREFGSDFNGLNATANQFINMLLIVEGGFTIASNVSLFKPMANEDYEAINRILSATKKIFIRIGLSFFAIGFSFSIFYALIVNTQISPLVSFLIFFMTIISAFVNLFFATKYKILLQSENKEYILNGIQVFTLVISQLFIIMTILLKGHMLLIRFSTMIGAILNSYVIMMITKKRYKFLDFRVEPDYNAIKGTKDLFVQKITSVIYSTAPLLFMSVTVGTMFASIYIVYENVFRLIKSIVYAFINAPRMGFGKLIAEKDLQYVFCVFLQYEFIVNLVMISVLTTASVLIMPFIKIYSFDLIDVDYKNTWIALLLIATTFFEIVHIPSGNIINVSGKFRVGRNIQAVASIVIMVTMVIGNAMYGFYGIMISVLITAIVLGLLEIIYVHECYFKNTLLDFIKIIVPTLLFSLILIFIEIRFLPSIESYLDFFFIGILLLSANSTILLLVGVVFNFKIVSAILIRLRFIYSAFREKKV